MQQDLAALLMAIVEQLPITVASVVLLHMAPARVTLDQVALKQLVEVALRPAVQITAVLLARITSVVQ